MRSTCPLPSGASRLGVTVMKLNALQEKVDYKVMGNQNGVSTSGRSTVWHLLFDAGRNHPCPLPGMPLPTFGARLGTIHNSMSSS